MQPIINPWLFYLVDLVGNLSVILWVLLVVLIAVDIASLLIWTYINDNCSNKTREEDVEAKLRFLKLFKRTLLPIILTVLLIAVIPSKKTIYTMIIVDNVTPNNLTTVGDTAKDTVDYIVDKVDQILNKDSSDEEDKE